MLPDLLDPCPKCHGSGIDPDNTYDPKMCPKCHGSGKILTEDGKKVLDLLRFVLKSETFEV